MGSLVASGFDRLSAIYFSLDYDPKRAKSCAGWAIIIVWCLSAVVASLPFYVKGVWFTYTSTGTIQLPTGQPVVLGFLGAATCAVWLNCVAIFIVIKIRKQEAAKCWANHVFRRDKKLAITLCVMIAAFTLSTLPCMVFLIVNDVHNTAPLLTGEAVVVYLFMTNSLWNCLVYCYRHREFREEVKKLFRSLQNRLKPCKCDVGIPRMRTKKQKILVIKM